jgi:hypothetical protein
MSNATPPQMNTMSRQSGPGIRAVNVLLGLWLIFSTFLWEHSPGSRTNTLVVGIAVAAIGIVGMVAPRIRFANTAAATWLFFSTFWLNGVTSGIAWHNAVVAFAVFVVSLLALPNGATGRMT